MYLTIIKKQEAIQTSTIDYRTLTVPVQNITDYYRITVNIEKPVTFTKLSDKAKRNVLNTQNQLIKAYEYLKPFEDNYTEQYYSFKIPKRTGGLRTINAPKDEFKDALSKVKDIFEKQIKCLPHNNAYAYIKTRSVLDAIKLHQKNKSNWYLKIDLKDFFPSCTPELIFKQLKQLFPFYYIDEKYDEILQKIISICCLDNGLPQGTPMSPILTNLLMVPIDYKIHNLLKRGTGNHHVYTRYADDILISSKTNFDWIGIQKAIQYLVNPFIIKQEKTRYGSKAGSNWNLGLMLNKDNNITLGFQKKKQLNAMLNNFLRDYKNKTLWNREDIYHLQGQLSYLKHIEETYYNYIISKYELKYNLDYNKTISRSLKGII